MSDCRFGVSPVNYPDPDPLQTHTCQVYPINSDLPILGDSPTLPPYFAQNSQISLFHDYKWYIYCSLVIVHKLKIEKNATFEKKDHDALEMPK